MKIQTKRLRTMISMLLAVTALALVVAGCGGGSSSSSTTSSTASTPASTTQSSTSSAPSSGGASSSGIPQGANAGDQDSDNQGGPSDGDGNL